MGLLQLESKPLVLTKSGSGGGTGYKVSFPATMERFDVVSIFVLFLANGTEQTITAYSTIAGRTIDGVVGIRCIASDYFSILKMTITNGTIAQSNPLATGSATVNFKVTTAPGTTPTPYAQGKLTFWWPLADTVISAIEMYNTD